MCLRFKLLGFKTFMWCVVVYECYECMYVRSITRKDLQHYIKTHYKSNRIVLAGAGGVNHDELVKLAEHHFGHLTSHYDDEVPQVMPARYTGSEVGGA